LPTDSAGVPDSAATVGALWIYVTDSSGNRYGPPILTATNWQSTRRLDRAGSFSFEMPAGDSRAAYLALKREVHAYAIVNDAVTEIGAGIIDEIQTIAGDPPMLRVSGDDLLRELTYRTVGSLELYGQSWATAGMVGHLYDSISNDMEEAHDGDTNTAYTLSTGLHTDQYLYVGHQCKFAGVRFDFDTFNTTASVLNCKYYSATDGWTDLSITDGTDNGGACWGQDGDVTWNRADVDDWQTTPHTVNAGGEDTTYDYYWVRFTVSVQTDQQDFAEVYVYEDGPTGTGLADIMAFAPSGWSVDDSGDGYAATENEVYLGFNGETVLEALTILAEQTGEHFRLGASGKKLEWLQDDPDMAGSPTSSGIRAIVPPVGLAAEDNENICLILDLTKTEDGYDQITRIYPYGAGIASRRVTLANTNRSAPAGYTLSKTDNYIEYDAGNPRIDRQVTWSEAYTLRVANLGTILEVGETIRVVYHDYVDGYHGVNIDADLLILEVTNTSASDGLRTSSLTVSSVDAWPTSEGDWIAGELANARRTTSSASTTATVTSGTSSGGDVTAASFITVEHESVLSNERTLAAGNNVTLTDGGVDGDITIDVDTVPDHDHTGDTGDGLQDWVNATQSAGLIAGGAITATTYTIKAADATANTFTIAGDVSAYFTNGTEFTVYGSTGNDGNYTTVGDATYNGGNDETTITVADVPDDTDDGSIRDGRIDVAAITGMVKTTDDSIDGVTAFVDVPAKSHIALTDASTNWVYASYGGGTPVIEVTDTFSDIDFNTEFMVGRVFRQGTELHILEASTRISNAFRRLYQRTFELRAVERASGALAADEGTRHFSVTAGVLYSGVDRFETDAFDSSGADRFRYWYHDGGGNWVSTDRDQAQIDNTQYDTGTGLATLANNRYGVHWIFLHNDSHIDVVYGRGSYKLAEAEAALVPPVPDICNDFATLVGRAIVLKNATELTTIETAFAEPFLPSVAPNHDDLSGVTADQHHNSYEIVNSSDEGVSVDADGTITAKLGDAAGAQKLSITDSGDAEVASVDSDGNAAVEGLNVNSADASTGQIAVEGSTWPVLKMTRTTDVTNGTVSSMMLKTKSSGDMINGFGGGMLFSIEDNAGTERLIAAIQAYRWADADNSGLLTLRTYNAGSLDDRLMITPAGNVLIMGNPTYERGPVLQVKSGPGEHGVRGIETTDGTAVEVVSNGNGDIAYVLHVRYVVRDSAGNVDSGTAEVTPGDSTNLYDDGGTNTLTLTVNANGSVQVQRTAGSRTYKVMLDLLWL